MSDELQVINEPIPSNPQPVTVSDEQLMTQIQAEQNKLAGITEQSNQIPAVTDPNIQPQPTGNPVPPQAVEPVAPPKAESGQAQPQQTTPEQIVTQGTPTFEELQSKQGFKSPDALAASYASLVKKLHSQAQELSQIKRATPVQQTMPQGFQQTQENYVEPNQVFLEDFAKNPLQTLATANQVLMQPLVQAQRQMELEKTIMRLSATQPEFNSPQIQAEMQKIMEEKPQRYMDSFGNPISSEFQDLYFTAKGRLGNVGVSQPQPQRYNSPTPVEGVNKPTQLQAVDARTMPIDDLKKAITNLQRQIN